jgi:Ca-activated chloride channel family protein
MYDAVAEAVPLAQSGKNRKKALVIISDGNDTSSQTTVSELKQMIRESEVLVYAIGIDGDGDPIFGRQPPGTFPPRVPPPPTRLPIPRPFPPGRRPPGLRPPGYQAAQRPGRAVRSSSERVNVVALRDLTDDSGGRTEIVRDSIDLNPATANIAAELSQQYYLGYPANGKRDGRWHAIRVDVKNPTYRVRARRGYVAN